VWVSWAVCLGYALLPLLGAIAGAPASASPGAEVCSAEHSPAKPGSLSDLDAAARLGGHGIHCALCATVAATGAPLLAGAHALPPVPAELLPSVDETAEAPVLRVVPDAFRPRGPPHSA
jgi:hypothetical protein